MSKIIIFGTSAGARLAHFSLLHDSPHEVVAFTVDAQYIREPAFCGLPVVPFEEMEALYPPDDYEMFVSILASRVNKTRAEKYQQAKTKGYRFINYVSSRAIVWPDLQLGENCFIGEGSLARPFLTLGNNVLVMAGTFLGHDSVIEDHCFVASRATLLGGVTVKPYCVLGANCTVLDGVTVAERCVIGAGAVIHENTQAQGVYRVTPPTRLPLSSERMENMLFRSE